MDGIGSKPLLPPKASSSRSDYFFSSDKSMEPSLPNNWPNSTPEEINARLNRNVVVGGEQEWLFNSNFVKTSKYELWNFIPKFFLEEFNPKTKVANCYFLLVASLQTIPQISNTFGYPTTLIPLICVVIVDGIFAAVEDISRHKADKEANSTLVECFNTQLNRYNKLQWADIKVGDFIKIKSYEKIPADVIVVGVSEHGPVAQGICYVETKSLDGETNLKIRHVAPNTASIVSLYY